MLHVNPNLVGTARFQLHIQRSRGVQAMAHAVMGHSAASIGTHDLSAPVDRMAPQRCIHLTAGNHLPPDHGKVMPLDIAPLELLDQRDMSLDRTGDQQAAAGILVKAMHEAGAGQGRKIRVEVQQAVDQSAGGIARARMHHQPGWLVDDQQRRIVDQHAQRHGLGFRIARVRPKLGIQIDPIALGETEIRLDHSAIDAQLAGPDPVTEPTPGKLRPDRGCGLVDSLARLVDSGLEAALNRSRLAHRQNIRA